MRYSKENVVNVSDIKYLMKKYISDYSKEEMEKNVKLWFDGEKGYNDLFDEG